MKNVRARVQTQLRAVNECSFSASLCIIFCSVTVMGCKMWSTKNDSIYFRDFRDIRLKK